MSATRTVADALLSGIAKVLVAVASCNMVLLTAALHQTAKVHARLQKHYKAIVPSA
jgi:hypothetical protein